MASEQDHSVEQRQQQKTLKKLIFIVLAMFGFGFALVPLYDVFCDVTGLNGKTSNLAANANREGIDVSRNVKVQFITRTAQGIPWQFAPMVNEIVVHPGETRVVKFFAKNNSVDDLIGQAVPSVSPGKAAIFFKKIECFCFNQQALKAGEEVEMALQFYVDTELPLDVSTITLSYTLYDITSKAAS